MCRTDACLNAELAGQSEGRRLVLRGGLIYIMEHLSLSGDIDGFYFHSRAEVVDSLRALH